MAITEETRQSELYREITAEFSKSVGIQMMERMKVEQAQKVRNFRTLNAMAEPGGILFIGSTEQIVNYKDIGFVRKNSFYYEKPMA